MDQIAAKARVEEFDLDYYTNRGVDMLVYGHQVLAKAHTFHRCKPVFYISLLD